MAGAGYSSLQIISLRAFRLGSVSVLSGSLQKGDFEFFGSELPVQGLGQLRAAGFCVLRFAAFGYR